MRKKLLAIVIIFTALLSSSTVLAEDSLDTYLSQDIQDACILYGLHNSISPCLLMALVEKESSGNNSAVNGSCYGCCQLNGAVWGYNYKTVDQQINKACKILLEYLEEEEEISFALDRYNGNSKAYKIYEAGELSEYANWILTRAYEIEEAKGLHNY